MPNSRLPSMLLTCYNSEKHGSVNHTLSKYLLEHIDTIKDLNIKDLADACFMSPSTVSRFCKSLGLSDFNELKQEFYMIDYYRDQKFAKPELIEEDFLLNISKEIIDLHQHLDYSKLKQLVEDLYNYKEVAVFGSMQSYSAALYLQTELYVSRKIVCCKESQKNQLAYYKETTDENLIIIFSATGSYFNLIFERKSHIPYLKKPKVWVITYNPHLKIENPDIDELIFVKNDEITYANHPLKFSLIADMIAGMYAKYCLKKEQE